MEQIAEKTANVYPRLPEFDEIRPYEPEEMRQAFAELLEDRQFQIVLKGFAPWLPKFVRNGLLKMAFTGVKTPLDFQKRFMKPVVNHIISKHTDGCTFSDDALEDYAKGQAEKGTDAGLLRYTFLSNHRDIVLDSAFLDVKLVERDYPTTVEIGIGDNLLIYSWIKRLVRMNKAFTVRRGLTPKEMLRSSLLMSQYIHYAVNTKHENIWIAQREGRAKDSNDRTQDAVLKMLAMGGQGQTPADKLRDLRIVPLTISYEYDPCDYLKAQEMQQKRDNPQFKKSRQDDLDNMKTGIFGYKGRVHYHCSAPVNVWLDELEGLSKQEFFAEVAKAIDKQIHAGYKLFPANYIAADMLAASGQTSGGKFASHYTDSDKKMFETYLDEQLAKIALPVKDEPFLRSRMLEMYANPLFNHIEATNVGGKRKDDK